MLAYWGRGGITPLFNLGTRSGWVVSSTLRTHLLTGKSPAPIIQQAGWAPESAGCTVTRHRIQQRSKMLSSALILQSRTSSCFLVISVSKVICFTAYYMFSRIAGKCTTFIVIIYVYLKITLQFYLNLCSYRHDMLMLCWTRVFHKLRKM